jgi:hypothetical protein
MRNLLLLLFIFLNIQFGNAQTLPVNRYEVRKLVLDLYPANPSFAYSLRKLKRGYNGFAVKIRRSSDNAEVNVNFDVNDIVSNSSNVIVTAVGTSALIIGQVLNYNTFIGASTAFVTTWYDQGTNAYHATQTTNTIQPRLVLNSAGALNTLPSILYDGSAPPDYLNVNQPIQNLTNSGINGSFLIVCKPTQNTSQLSFGTRFTSEWRWAFHINWTDGNCYFDASEICCAGNRAFANGGNINLYKQYSFVRGTTFKTARINGIATTLNNSPAGSTANIGGSFFIGAWSGLPGSTGFFGNTSEIIMFPTDLTNIQLAPVESNQVSFWGL